MNIFRFGIIVCTCLEPHAILFFEIWVCFFKETCVAFSFFFVGKSQKCPKIMYVFFLSSGGFDHNVFFLCEIFWDFFEFCPQIFFFDLDPKNIFGWNFKDILFLALLKHIFVTLALDLVRVYYIITTTKPLTTSKTSHTNIILKIDNIYKSHKTQKFTFIILRFLQQELHVCEWFNDGYYSNQFNNNNHLL